MDSKINPNKAATGHENENENDAEFGMVPGKTIVGYVGVYIDKSRVSHHATMDNAESFFASAGNAFLDAANTIKSLSSGLTKQKLEWRTLAVVTEDAQGEPQQAIASMANAAHPDAATLDEEFGEDTPTETGDEMSNEEFKDLLASATSQNLDEPAKTGEDAPSEPTEPTEPTEPAEPAEPAEPVKQHSFTSAEIDQLTGERCKELLMQIGWTAEDMKGLRVSRLREGVYNNSLILE